MAKKLPKKWLDGKAKTIDEVGLVEAHLISVRMETLSSSLRILTLTDEGNWNLFLILFSSFPFKAQQISQVLQGVDG